MEFKSIDYNEDYIFDNDKNNILLNDYDGFIYTGPIDYYNTGTMRLVEYFPHLDLYKIVGLSSEANLCRIRNTAQSAFKLYILRRIYATLFAFLSPLSCFFFK